MIQLVTHCAQPVGVVALPGQVPHGEGWVIGVITVKASSGWAAHVKRHLDGLIVVQAGKAFPSEEEGGFQTFGIVGEAETVCLACAIHKDFIATDSDSVVMQECADVFFCGEG